MAATLLAGIILFVISAVGVIGNISVLCVLLCQKSSWSISITYVFNLAVADALLMLVTPFWGHLFISNGNWFSGQIMCKLAYSISAVNMLCSIMFVVAMSVDRLVAVVRLMNLDRFRTRKVTNVVCGLIWLIGLGFFIHFMLDVSCYLSIFIHVKRHAFGQNTAQDKVVKPSTAIIITFFVGWFPANILNFYSGLATYFHVLSFSKECFDNLYPYSLCLAWATSSINPILYAFVRSDFRSNLAANLEKFKRTNHMVLKETTSPQLE
ncbi:type-2 angiotensin II receptor-like [Clavelina lepadiformis]|uniref:type-2 angiotensin II receptor-like n=1 Tax=Clavelina lepadiformis TaxID=159417 RepID=UPI0040423692